MEVPDVPVTNAIEDIYPRDALPHQNKRWDKLYSQFEQRYGRAAEFVSRSPGRVNLIGEHIDYSLYEVMPMAVTVDVLLAVSISQSSKMPTMRIANVISSKFPDREFEIAADGSIDIDAEAHEWSNYFKSGLRGATELLRKKRGKDFVSVGMDILVDGTVPAGGGLSSSAAFVCASALAVMKANGFDVVDKKELVELAVVSERAVGVNSGGMDQSASVFCLHESAIYVSFKPTLSAKAIKFPSTQPELAFVVAQSFVAADKHVTAPVCYNLRVVECSLAAEFLAKIFRLTRPLPKDDSPLQVSLRGFHDTYFEEKDGIPDNTKTPVDEFQDQLGTLAHMVEEYLGQEDGYTRADIAAVLGISVDELNARFTTKVPVRAERFMLRQRALHVFTEAARVIKFMSLLSHPPESGEQLLTQLGALMNETQESCDKLYDCSCPELNELCAIAREAGSYGSRLTGAGWGGCSVHLVPREKVEAVTRAWEERYYRKRFPEWDEERMEEAVVKPVYGYDDDDDEDDDNDDDDDDDDDDAWYTLRTGLRLRPS